MPQSRRAFLKKFTAGAAGIAVSSTAIGMKPQSYRRITGANDRLNIAVIGLGARFNSFIDPITASESNVHVAYLCDVMESQRIRAANLLSDKLNYKPKLENDVRKVLEDKSVDAVLMATPDHWHTPGAILALRAGKHVYLEKPCSHNMFENELIVKARDKYRLHIQMGNQQRSSLETADIISQIHDGIIGTAYKALTFYTNSRGEVPVATPAPVPAGLDWELFQGPAPRSEYKHDTWGYNWHWYEWDYGTGETGNNATHELDIARWALCCDYPERVEVEASKRHFLNDGWTMYDTMDATFRFPGDKIIKWDGKSRNGFDTYGGGRGTIIYGSEGSVFINRNLYRLTDRKGKPVREVKFNSNEAGNTIGGGGDTTTSHVVNFLDTIRGKATLKSPIADAAISQSMTHYANIAYRIGKGFDIDPKTGVMYDKKAMELWGRSYEPGWEPLI
jgi:predicted dehydrogenase